MGSIETTKTHRVTRTRRDRALTEKTTRTRRRRRTMTRMPKARWRRTSKAATRAAAPWISERAPPTQCLCAAAGHGIILHAPAPPLGGTTASTALGRGADLVHVAVRRRILRGVAG